MRYSIQCERCQRPADTRERKVFDKGTHVLVQTKKADKCTCGGKIIVTLE